MSKQQKFSKLLGQRLEAAHQEVADDLMWQQLQQRMKRRSGKLSHWLASAASVAALGLLTSGLYFNQLKPDQSMANSFELEQLDAAIQQSIMHNDTEQFERLLVQRQQLNKPQPRTISL